MRERSDVIKNKTHSAEENKKSADLNTKEYHFQTMRAAIYDNGCVSGE